ncbi:MAG TPA: DUF2809 domain-containing protein [Kineosporiaceae bacterium]|nr:DUF2809 domain-containing protein [Kineosporiaceae bacterium]
MPIVPLSLRRRLPIALGLVLICSAGLAFPTVAAGPVANVGRDALYAVGIYALVLLICPQAGERAVAVVTAAICWGVEFAQLTGFPAEASRHSSLARVVLGSTFNPADLAFYLIGVLLATAVTAVLRSRWGYFPIADSDADRPTGRAEIPAPVELQRLSARLRDPAAGR